MSHNNSHNIKHAAEGLIGAAAEIANRNGHLNHTLHHGLTHHGHMKAGATIASTIMQILKRILR